MKESENIGQHLDRLRIAHARGDQLVRGHARVGYVYLYHGRGDARCLDGLDLLYARNSAGNEVFGLEGDAVARAVLDLLPQCLKLKTELDFLPELQLPAIVRIDNTVLEDFPVDLISAIVLNPFLDDLRLVKRIEVDGAACRKVRNARRSQVSTARPGVQHVGEQP